MHSKYTTLKSTILVWGSLLSLMNTVNAQLTPNQIASNTYVQADSDKLSDQYRPVFLTDAIEQGLRKNYSQEVRKYQDEILDIEWKDTKEDFWMPKLELSLVTAEQRVGTLRNGSKETGKTSTRPSGTFALNFGEYTIFNWGKDYLTYLNSKSSYLRNKSVLKEEVRDLKHQIIIQFFDILKFKNIERIRRDQLRHSSYIYRLNQEKISLKKISKQDYYYARAEYLKAQTDYYQAKTDLIVSEESLAVLINDNPGTRYVISETLDYKKLTTSMTEAIKVSLQKNSSILNATTTVNNTNRNYELNLKDSLPLPKLSVNLGAYNHKFSGTSNSTTFETQENNSNIEVVATINATWSLTGTGGLLNGRKNRKSLLHKYVALKEKSRIERVASSIIRNSYKKITHYQNQMTILDARIPTLQKKFDSILENYINKRTRYIDFSAALEELTETKILKQSTLHNHLKEKITLANTMGVEDFSGENFEKLALKSQRTK